MPLLRLEVGSGPRAYPILIAPGLLERFGPVLDDAGIRRRRFAISSPTIWKLHGRTIARGTQKLETILVPDGERFKQLSTVSRVYDGLIRAQADRAATVLAVGGGVIGDLVGLAAATYLRGIALVQVPTTLLAQVDSAIGGKVGVNHPLGKNLIGAFYPPALVATDPLVLATLPRREFRAGLYEVVKYGVIASRDLFDRVRRDLSAIFAREPGTLVPIIAECCRIKGQVVTEDEHERGPRRILNFGHTAGHALEAITRYRRFRHGEAVAYGMLAAARVATARGLLSGDDLDALKAVIAQMGPLPAVSDLSARQVLEAVRRDKKVIDGRLHFVLPTSIGSTSIVDDVTAREIERALRGIGLRH